MRRLRSYCLLLGLSFSAVVALPTAARAQDRTGSSSGGATGDQATSDDLPPDLEAPPAEPPPSDEELTQGGAESSPDSGARVASAEDLQRAQRMLWKDIAVVPRKHFLKRLRLELTPFIGTTINDTLIQHTVLGGDLTYFITDVLAISAQGLYFISDVTKEEFYVRYHLDRVPTLNKYLYGANGNFSYTPIYGKFSIFGRPIVHWDASITGGVGVTWTEVIPRDFRNESFKNVSLTFPIGIGARVFLTRWLSLQIALRDYMMLDKFEQPGRDIQDGAEAKAKQSDTQFVNNFIFTAGVGFYFPFGFDYSTPR